MPHKGNTAIQAPRATPQNQVQHLIDSGDLTGARDILLQTLKTSKTPALYCDLGEVYARMKKLNEATIAYENAIKLDPKCHKAYACIAEMLIAEGHIFHAIDYYALAIKAEPRELRYITIFLTISSVLRLKSFNKDLKQLLTSFLERPDISFSTAARLWQDLLWKDPAFKDFSKNARKDNATAQEEFKKIAARNKSGLLDPYFLLGLEKVIAPSLEFERLLTRLRRLLLEQLDAKEPIFTKGEYIKIASALSCYCLLTEYIFDLPDDENNTITSLATTAQQGGPVDESRLALLACYTYISTFKNAAEISSALKKSSTPEMHNFALVHLDDYLEQQKIKKEIPAITKIKDSVSERVREQYEEFPYPRWTDLNPLMLGAAEPEKELQQHPITILNAGCGTGQEALQLASLFPNAKVLAVDLSLTSLAYGAKRARDLSIGNIEFKQGDILELGRLGKTYDYIASGGVLHHMGDPSKGLSVLAGLLKAGGLMRLGLYSEIAREAIVKARHIIREKNIGSTAGEMRTLRRTIDALLDDAAIEKITNYRDYYTLSECRDLLFHVQEHRFTIPQLKALLDAQGLEFIQFHINPQVLAQYKKAYPQDPQGQNLDLWNEFEKKHPDTFIEMYKFWCRKKPL